MSKMIFSKLNDEPLRLDSEFVNADDDDTSLFFEYNGAHHYWDNIVSRKSEWFPKIELPDFIDGIDLTDYWNPLFVEVVEVDIPDYEYDIAFNVYGYLEGDDDEDEPYKNNTHEKR